MKRTYRYLTMLIFVISSFLFINNVEADRPATVFNPQNSSCHLYDGSAGKCFYKNENLNSYVNSVIWLDTGDKVTILDNYEKITSNDTNLCSDYYVYISYYFPKKQNTYYGYYCNADLVAPCSNLTDELKEEFSNAKFPESYWCDLSDMKAAHPTWSFVALDTKLDFNTAVNGENSLGRSLIQVVNGVNDQGYLNTWSGSYNYYTDTFTPFDGSTWYAANYDTIAYYMDPRNFLTDMYVFQFEKLSFINTISEEKYMSAISSIFKDDYLKNYTIDFYNAGKDENINVNPIYLASLSYQEVKNGETPGTAINGLYNGMYNFYNIGAYSDTSPVYNGLDFAKIEDIESMRPWDTPYKAIAGGAKWIAKKYINIGQDTMYFQKWDVVSNINSESGTDYVHQYQTAIQAPSIEATTTYRSYSSTGILDLDFVFYIPVYDNMPEFTSLPTKGNPNNYLSNLTIDEIDVPGFDGGIDSYNYYHDINKNKITINASPVNGKAKITGIGTFEISEDCTKTISVVSENGIEKKYEINIILTGEKIDAPVDIVTTLNNAGIKNGNQYISGLTLESDIKVIKEKISIANKDAEVTLADKNDNPKDSGKVSTGDKVTVKVGEETKTYEIVIYGDVNGDGAITASDYARVKNTFLKKSTLNGAFKEAADANKSGDITASDYARIKNTFLNKSTIEQ